MKKIIPLSGGILNANYSQYVTLGDFSLQLVFAYQQNGQWVMDVIADGDVGEVPVTTLNDIDYIALGVMLEGGLDLVEAYNISKTFGQLYFVGEEATLNNLGKENNLVWYSSDDAVSF